VDRSAHSGEPFLAATTLNHAAPAKSGSLRIIMNTTNERPSALPAASARPTRSLLKAAATTTALILFAGGVMPAAALAQITFQPEKKPPAPPAPNAPDQGPMQVPVPKDTPTTPRARQPRTTEPRAPRAAMPRPTKLNPLPTLTTKDLDAAVSTGVERLLSMQETFEPGQPKAEWPYQGVYRVNGQIPIGYRVGGTAICATALLLAPGYDKDEPRQAAVARACVFVCEKKSHQLMSIEDYDAGYDVRGWGYTYGLDFLLALKRLKAVPQDQTAAVDASIAHYLRAIEETQIPISGGWNYARPDGKETKAAPSSFMTASTLITLIEARAQGLNVNQSTIDKAVAFLIASRAQSTDDGVGSSVLYSGTANPRRSAQKELPGAMGRMCVVESALTLAGATITTAAGEKRPASGDKHLSAAVEAFIEHWDELDKRRMMTGTHIGPFGVAPYYFMYAHRHAALATELLTDEPTKARLREKTNALLFSVRSEDGTWNDRVFPRSANFGTAFAMMAIMSPRLAAPTKLPSIEVSR